MSQEERERIPNRNAQRNVASVGNKEGDCWENEANAHKRPRGWVSIKANRAGVAIDYYEVSVAHVEEDTFEMERLFEMNDENNMLTALVSGGVVKNKMTALVSGSVSKHEMTALVSAGVTKNEMTALVSDGIVRNEMTALVSGGIVKNEMTT